MNRVTPCALTAAFIGALAGRAAANAVDIPATVNLSDINGANGFRVIGVAADDSCGSGVAAADLNGDGISDLIIGAKYADPDAAGGAGETYVIFGRRTLPNDPTPATFDPATLDGDNGFRITALTGNFSGASIANAGDVNGDKVDDVIIGAPYANGTGGAAYVVYGSKTTPFPASFSIGVLEGSNGFRAEDFVAGEYAGTAVAAGDINGDKLSDVIVGAPFANAGAGAVYVVFGRKTTSANDLPLLVDLAKLDGTNGFRIGGLSGGDQCGRSLATADLNADRIADLIIGAPFADPNADNAAGSTYVIFGRKATTANPYTPSFDLADLDGTNGFRIDGIDSGDNSGASVANAGDFNADRVNDLVIGAPGADLVPNAAEGEAYVFFGKKASNTSPFPATFNLASIDGITGTTFYGAQADGAAGTAVSAAGDINGDRIADIIISQPGVNSETGQATVVFGRKPTSADPLPVSVTLNTINGDDGFRIVGELAGDQVGLAVASAGDFNADKISDLIVGAPLQGAGGEAAIIYGPSPEAQVTLEGVSIAALSVPIVHDGGSVPLGTSSPQKVITATFGVSNLGLSELSISRLKAPRGATISQQPDPAVSPLNAAAFTLQIPTPRTGNFSGKVSFNTNDPDEKKYEFTMTWSVVEIASSSGDESPVIDIDILADLDSDWITTTADLVLMLRAMQNDDRSAGADLNGDDVLDSNDLVILLQGFNR